MSHAGQNSLNMLSLPHGQTTLSGSDGEFTHKLVAPSRNLFVISMQTGMLA
jgi:hypothetical protein